MQNSQLQDSFVLHALFPDRIILEVLKLELEARTGTKISPPPKSGPNIVICGPAGRQAGQTVQNLLWCCP